VAPPHPHVVPNAGHRHQRASTDSYRCRSCAVKCIGARRQIPRVAKGPGEDCWRVSKTAREALSENNADKKRIEPATFENVTLLRLEGTAINDVCKEACWSSVSDGKGMRKASRKWVIAFLKRGMKGFYHNGFVAMPLSV
jgi:hypothetical protein